MTSRCVRMVKLIIYKILILNSHLPAAIFFFGSPKGMPPKKKKTAAAGRSFKFKGGGLSICGF